MMDNFTLNGALERHRHRGLGLRLETGPGATPSRAHESRRLPVADAIERRARTSHGSLNSDPPCLRASVREDASNALDRMRFRCAPPHRSAGR
jgi:hypothetical protein